MGAVKVTAEGVEFAVDIDGEPGVADSGTLSRDLAEVFVAAGEAAKACNSSIVIPVRRNPESAARGVRDAHHGRV